MNTKRAIRLGFLEEILTANLIRSIVEWKKLESDPQRMPNAKRIILLESLNLSYFSYVAGDDDQAFNAANDAVEAAKEYFFGAWRCTVPSGNYLDKPSDARWWHEGDFYHLQDCTDSMTLASCIGDWNFIDRIARHMLEIPWQNIRSGRETNALRMALAGVIRGQSLDKDLSRFVKLVTAGNKKKEKLLLEFLKRISQGSDQELQKAANAYFDYFLKVESKAPRITSKVMIEGTLYVNLARHFCRKLEVPGQIGERYIVLPPPTHG